MEKKKIVKKKEPKKKIIPFDQIDIKTATEDDIIKSGLKHNTKLDTTCYFIMFIIFVLAVLPLALRIIIPRPITKKEKDIVYNKVKCYKTTVRDEYELATTIYSNYRDGEIQDVTFEFKYFKRSDLAKDGYVFAEIEKIADVQQKGVTVDRTAGKVNIKVDFENYPELTQNEILKDYTYYYQTQIKLLKEDQGYACNTEANTVREFVDVKTGKKVE